MTMIDVDTSPLQAAREWRGIGLVAAAMTSGLPMAQAEALEDGDHAAFDSIDEMIAAAIVYGSSLGIGRDEAVALLDRTVSRSGVQVQLPDPMPAERARPRAGFSEAVAGRSARIASRENVSTTPILAGWEDDDIEEIEPEPGGTVAVAAEPVVPESELPAIPEGPTPEQAVAASGEIHIDEFGPEAPWERSGFTSELEAWAEDMREDDDEPVAAVDRPSRANGLGTRVIGGTHAAIERILGTGRADAAAEWMSTSSERLGAATRDFRERMRQSEHATLLFAIGGGAVLIALVVALGGALGGSDDTKGPGPADRAAVTSAGETPTGDVAATADPKPAVKAPAKAAAAPLPPSKLTLDVFNAGSKKGYAKEVAAKLEGYGYRVDAVTNAKSDYSSATIIHPADLAREAKMLARRTGISTLQVAPGSTRKITIIVM